MWTRRKKNLTTPPKSVVNWSFSFCSTCSEAKLEVKKTPKNQFSKRASFVRATQNLFQWNKTPRHQLQRWTQNTREKHNQSVFWWKCAIPYFLPSFSTVDSNKATNEQKHTYNIRKTSALSILSTQRIKTDFNIKKTHFYINRRSQLSARWIIFDRRLSEGFFKGPQRFRWGEIHQNLDKEMEICGIVGD